MLILMRWYWCSDTDAGTGAANSIDSLAGIFLTTFSATVASEHSYIGFFVFFFVAEE